MVFAFIVCACVCVCVLGGGFLIKDTLPQRGVSREGRKCVCVVCVYVCVCDSRGLGVR